MNIIILNVFNNWHCQDPNEWNGFKQAYLKKSKRTLGNSSLSYYKIFVVAVPKN